jgi:hypothetical protein
MSVEVAPVPGGVEIWHGKDPEGPRLQFSEIAWAEFESAASAGEFDMSELSRPSAEAGDETAPDKLPTQTSPLEFLIAYLLFRAVNPESLAPAAAENKVTGTTLNLASSIIGAARSDALEEWGAEAIAGAAGELETTSQRLRLSFGFILAALRIRASHLAEPAITRFDECIRSASKTRRTVVIVMSATALYLLHAEGFIGVFHDADNLAVEGASLYGGAAYRRKTLKDRDAIAGVDPPAEQPPGPPRPPR